MMFFDGNIAAPPTITVFSSARMWMPAPTIITAARALIALRYMSFLLTRPQCAFRRVYGGRHATGLWARVEKRSSGEELEQGVRRSGEPLARNWVLLTFSPLFKSLPLVRRGRPVESRHPGRPAGRR